MFVFATQRGQHILTKRKANWLAAILHQDWRNHKCTSNQQCSIKITCPVMPSCRIKCLNTEFQEETNSSAWLLPQSNNMRECMISACIENIKSRTVFKKKGCFIKQSWKCTWPLLSFKHFTWLVTVARHVSTMSNRDDYVWNYGNQCADRSHWLRTCKQKYLCRQLS